MGKNYVSKIAKENGMSESQYLKEASKNFVVIENGKPWAYTDGSPLIYGDKEKVQEDIDERRAETDKVLDIKIITEMEYINSLAA